MKGERAKLTKNILKFLPSHSLLSSVLSPLPTWKTDVMLEVEQPSCDREAIGRTETTLNVAEQKELSPCKHHVACVLSCFSRILFSVTPWTVALQAPLSMGFSRQECWSGLPLPPLVDLPDPGIKPTLLHWQADSLPLEPHIHISPIFLDFLPLQVIKKHQAEFPVIFSMFSLVIYFIHNISSFLCVF